MGLLLRWVPFQLDIAWPSHVELSVKLPNVAELNGTAGNSNGNWDCRVVSRVWGFAGREGPKLITMEFISESL